MVARDEELSSASLIPLKIHVLIVCLEVPEGQTGTARQWEDETESLQEESLAKEGEQMKPI